MLTTNAPWTKNQTEYVIDSLNNSSQVEFLVTSLDKPNLPQGSKVIIKKQNVYKSTSCGNRVTNCFNTDRVIDFTANRYRR